MVPEAKMIDLFLPEPSGFNILLMPSALLNWLYYGNGYRLRDHMELIPDHIRAKKSLQPPPKLGKKRRTRIRKGGEEY